MSYTRVNWENLPSTNTPLNATNLDKMDAGIANAVEKTGDTLTGFLDFNNKNEYHVFRKTRTVNNVDYKANLGISAAPSARLEFQDANENTLGRLDVKSDGIYNGLSNKKLAEQSSGWTNATLASNIDGSVIYTKIGNVVIVHIIDFVINKQIAAHQEELVSGLPKSTKYIITALFNYNSPSVAPLRIGITSAGTILTHYSNVPTTGSNGFYGTLIYITNE